MWKERRRQVTIQETDWRQARARKNALSPCPRGKGRSCWSRSSGKNRKIYGGMVCKAASRGSHVMFSTNKNDVSAEFVCELLQQIKAVEPVFSHTRFKAVAPGYFVCTWRGCKGKHPLLILELFLAWGGCQEGFKRACFWFVGRERKPCGLVPFWMGCASFPGAVRLENLKKTLNKSSYIWHTKCCGTSYIDL